VVLKTGKLLYCKNKAELIDFRDQVKKIIWILNISGTVLTMLF